MRRRLNYANVTATLALFFAMSSGALAAKHYLINSTKQINPKVLKSLKGNVGPAGAPGKEGAAGKVREHDHECEREAQRPEHAPGLEHNPEQILYRTAK